MTRNATRILALAAISATAVLGLTACGAGTGNNSAPDNDQSSAKALAESYFQDVTHLDTAKLSALLTKPLSKAQQAGLSASVEQWGDKSPYSEFHVASVEPQYDGNGYKHKADVNYTYKYNGKLTKGHLYTMVDPTIDDKVWMIDTGANGFSVDRGTQYAVNVASNTVTIKGKTTKVDKNTLIFPGIPYSQKITFKDDLLSPVNIKNCGELFSSDNSCKVEKTSGGDLDKQKVQSLALAAVKEKVKDPAINRAPKLEGDGEGNSPIGAILGTDGSDFGSQGLAAYQTYGAAGNYYKPGTDPKIDVSDSLYAELTGGSYQAYDFVENYTDEGCTPGSETALGCNKPIRSYSYETAWHTYSYDGWTVNFNKNGVVTKVTLPFHDESDIVQG